MSRMQSKSDTPSNKAGRDSNEDHSNNKVAVCA